VVAAVEEETGHGMPDGRPGSRGGAATGDGDAESTTTRRRTLMTARAPLVEAPRRGGENRAPPRPAPATGGPDRAAIAEIEISFPRPAGDAPRNPLRLAGHAMKKIFSPLRQKRLPDLGFATAS